MNGRVESWPTRTPESRWKMSCASLALSSTICSLESSRSAGSRVIDPEPNEDLKSSVWHIDSRSTMTSMGRPDGAVKYICRSPFRLLNLRSPSQPALWR
jgi:hypothetical protein